MNINFTYPLFLSALILIAAPVLADVMANKEYELIALKDCKTVKVIDLTPEQIAAYRDLNTEDKKMHELERPIQAFDEQMDQYSQQMDDISDLVVQETETEMHVDKVLMAKQEAIAHKIESLMQKHKDEFKALEIQGARLSVVADRFERLIKPSIADLDFNHIEIKEKGQNINDRDCAKITRLM